MSLCEECPVNVVFGNQATKDRCEEVVVKLAALGIVCDKPIETPKPPKGFNPFSPAKIFSSDGSYLGQRVPREVTCGLPVAVEAYIEEHDIDATPAEIDAVTFYGDTSILEQVQP